VNGISTGSFTYNYNAAGANTLNETSGSAALRVTHLGPTAVGTQSVVITVVSGTVYPIGAYVIDTAGGNGVILNNFGASGSTSVAWNRMLANNPIFASELSNLNITNSTVVANVMLWGANELVANVAPATYASNFLTFLNSMKANYPNADFAVATGVDNGTPGLTYTMNQYANLAQDMARNNGAAYLGNWELMRSYSRDNTLGLMADVTHPNHAAGYQLLANNEKLWLSMGHTPRLYSYFSGLRSFYLDPSGKFPGYANTSNPTGARNTGIGWSVSHVQTTGQDNTYFGYDVGAADTSGSGNTCVGSTTCVALTTAGAVTALGDHALDQVTGLGNTGIGGHACHTVTTGSKNMCLGNNAGSGDGATSGMSNTLVIGATTYFYNNVYCCGGITNASPQSMYNWWTTGASGTNIAGSSQTFGPGAGTGNSTPSIYVLAGPALGTASGTAQQTQVPRLVVNDTKQLTSGSAVTVGSFPLATLQMVGGWVNYFIEATDGTNQCVLSGDIHFAGENSAGTFKTGPTAATGNNQSNFCTGAATLTATWSLTGANPALLQVTPTTSITPTSFDIVYELHSMGRTAVTP
jgi:hypothetical protein